MLKLNVGLSRKIGEANYGSRGASVNLELELDSSLIEHPDRLRDRVRQLFGLARLSVEEELSGHGTARAETNGHAPQNGRPRDNTRRATASQIRALNTIADRQGVKLTSLLSERYSLTDPAALSITEASQLIDELKAAGNGAGGRR